jgi:PAS domain-containing protein
VETSSQRPLELILARNLLSSLSTPAFLVSRPGDMIFYNEAAGALLGRPFEEAGQLAAQDWVNTFGPYGDDGDPLPIDEQPLTTTLRENRAAHARHRIRSLDGTEHDVEVTGLPIIGADRFHGAMVFFWPADKGEGAR